MDQIITSLGEMSVGEILLGGVIGGLFIFSVIDLVALIRLEVLNGYNDLYRCPQEDCGITSRKYQLEQLEEHIQVCPHCSYDDITAEDKLTSRQEKEKTYPYAPHLSLMERVNYHRKLQRDRKLFEEQQHEEQIVREKAAFVRSQQKVKKDFKP